MDRKANRVALSLAIGSVAAVGGYYLASPFLAIQGLRSGFLSRNADQVNQYIDYPSLQSDLKGQLGSMMLRSMQSDPEMAANPFSGFAMAMITPMVNSMVDTYVTPSGMKSVLEASSTQQSGGVQDQTVPNLIEQKKEFDKALQNISMGYDGLNKFQLMATADDGKKTTLVFHR
ncbi:MAG: DUF2939 domain-containing protein [Cyanobacteriota bacterium]|nr:DUF2939 domain-containing protein [Cyanobacteriota bacterium]